MNSQIPDQFKVLFATFPPPAGELAAQLEAYAIAIEGHDGRDISAAVRRFLRGEVDGHNPNFAPTAAKLGLTIRQSMDDRLDSERRDRERTPALPAPDIVKSAESQARVQALVATAVATMVGASLTEDAAYERRKAVRTRKVQDRFAVDMTPAAMARRLGFEVGDPDGERDAG